MGHLSVRKNHRLQVARLFNLAILKRKVDSATKEGGNRLKWWKQILELRKQMGWY